MTYQHIEHNPAILNGKAIIKGTRISVQLILEILASGGSIDSIIKEYPHIKKEDVVEAINYAANQMQSNVAQQYSFEI